jgi:hypothetical protein
MDASLLPDDDGDDADGDDAEVGDDDCEEYATDSVGDDDDVDDGVPVRTS